jgi:hypothetical protein
VIGTTGCTGGTFNALQFVPLNGNVVVDQFPEQGQAQCAIQPNGSLICIFPALTGTSGPIDVREQAAPNGFTVMRSSDGGQTWDAATWASSGP